jgi:hypothetical protein
MMFVLKLRGENIVEKTTCVSPFSVAITKYLSLDTI